MTDSELEKVRYAVALRGWTCSGPGDGRRFPRSGRRILTCSTGPATEEGGIRAMSGTSFVVVAVGGVLEVRMAGPGQTTVSFFGHSAEEVIRWLDENVADRS